MKYDLIIIGSGPGGYVAAIRASQLGLKVAVVERAELGGICLNWGCIPTKSLLKSAQVYEYIKSAGDYGIQVEKVRPDLAKIVERSRAVAQGMSKGVQFLFKKNKIDHVGGSGYLKDKQTVFVKGADQKETEIKASHIIIATGARSRELANLKQDGKKIIGYREAMTPETLPEKLVVVGSGAIGSEFAYFYNIMGSKVTLVEFMPNVLPLEDEEVSRQMERSFKKAGVEVMTSSTVESANVRGKKIEVSIKTSKGVEKRDADVVLSAVGITPNIENMGIEDLGIGLDGNKIKVDEFYRTSVPGIYAIGDVIPGPALAHAASAEGIICVEKIAGRDPQPLNYLNVPGCTYTIPEVASVGYTETAAKEAGYEIRVGKFPFTASGKASAAGHKEGFVKLIFDAKYGELLGAHMIGNNVTELISEAVVAKNLESTGQEIIRSVHPHPTMSEAIMEAAAAAYGEVIHL
ncbi:MAG: dihydrolipoyl dehydrogenase [Bacteroidales bacterium]|nr:dihydrolipoyl dehydrogenase [Bacteroidales bacterium]